MVESMLSSANMEKIHRDYRAQMISIQKQKDQLEQEEYERLAAVKTIQQQQKQREEANSAVKTITREHDESISSNTSVCLSSEEE